MSADRKQIAKLKHARAAAAERRELMLEDVVAGRSHVVLAQKYGISVRTVRREVDRALDARHLDAPDRYVCLQVERLTLAIQTIDHALAKGDYRAVDPLLKVIEKLDRYHGISRPPPPGAAEAPARLEAAAAPLTLVDARREAIAAGSPTPAVPLPRA